jgi:hypothetical protein
MMTEPPFDMDLFMRVCGWERYEFRQNPEHPEETVLWWNQECMTFGRVGERFFYNDVDDWEHMDAFFARYPEAEIVCVSHVPAMGTGQPRQGYLNVHTRLTAPWPTTFDEAFDLLVRWDCQAEEERAELRAAYNRAAKRQMRPARGERHTLK